MHEWSLTVGNKREAVRTMLSETPVSRVTMRYQSQRSPEESELTERIKDIAYGRGQGRSPQPRPLNR